MQKRRAGQSFLEFALILPVLVILLVGIVDMARLFTMYTALRDAAQEGANFGSYNPTDTAGITSRVQHFENAYLDMSTVTVAPPVLSPNGCVGSTITVSVTSTFTITTPFMGAIIGQSFPVTGKVTEAILKSSC